MSTRAAWMTLEDPRKVKVEISDIDRTTADRWSTDNFSQSSEAVVSSYLGVAEVIAGPYLSVQVAEFVESDHH